MILNGLDLLIVYLSIGIVFVSGMLWMKLLDFLYSKINSLGGG